MTGIFVSGDSNGDGLLDLDETWIFQATGIATEGQYQNDATVTGAPLEVTNPDGTTTPPPPVDGDDDDRYFGASPGVSIVKAVNGEDANDAPGHLVPNGEEVSWTYTVTNTGDSPLIDIAVTDDQGVVVTCPATALDIGEAMECTGAAQTATVGQYTNIGTVNATPAAPTGEPGVFSPVTDPETGQPVGPVTDEDPANHFGTGPGIDIQKTVCTLDEASACDVDNAEHWAETTVAANGDDVTWRISVTNIGNIDLADVAVSDPLVASCEQTLPLLAIGETWVYTCTGVITGPMANTALVEGTPAAGEFPPVGDVDSADTLGPPELGLTKTVDGAEVFVGDTATYELQITNSGVTDAADIEILDTLPAGLGEVSVPDGSGLTYDESTHTITWLLGSLAVGETVAVSYTGVVVEAGPLVNEAEILTGHEENDVTDNIDKTTTTVETSEPPEPVPPLLAFTGASSWTLFTWSMLLLSLGLLLFIGARRRSYS